jgi:hypothetical protein
MTVKEIWQGTCHSLEPEDESYVMANVIQNELSAKLFLEGCA